MDKPNIIYDENAHMEVHSLPKGIRQFHQQYGLWICRFSRWGTSPPRDDISPRYFEFYCISHLLEGQGRFWLPEGQEQVFKPGQAVVVAPRQVHFYSGFQDHYTEETVCFVGPVADMLFRSGVLKTGVIDMGMTRRLLPIIDAAMDPARDSQVLANSELQHLISSLYLENKKKRQTKGESVISDLLAKIQENVEQWWTVSYMAEYCNLSEMQLRRVFHAQTGMSPKAYIDNLKIQRAVERLSSTDDKVAEIADSLGYTDQFHFSRRFKEITGYSPVNYRREILGR